MKKYIKLKPRPKKHKPTAISNYKVSYLDKRSKTYHRIIMTSFSGIIGLVGLFYVFTSGAANSQNSTTTNADNLFLNLIVLISLFLLLIAAYIGLGLHKK